LELLEDRLAPAVVTVTTVADDITPNDGSVSLREAITAVNAGNNLGDPDIIAQNPGVFGTNDTIHFNIPGSAPFQINVGSSASAAGIPLPQITQPVVIDGTTQTGFAGMPVVIVNGASAGANANGFDVELGTGVFSNGATIKGLVINQFSSNGVKIGADNVSGSGGFDNTITGDYIGTNVAGTSAVANGANGVFINGVDSNNLGTQASNNLIAGNVISGNTNDGVLIQANVNGIATGNLVSGNFIGTTAAGAAALGNGAAGTTSQTGNSGVEIVSASGNLVGGTSISGNSIAGTHPAGLSATAGTGNVIAGNAANGIRVVGTLTDPASTNGAAANFVGVDASGNSALGNARFGIEISGGNTNTVGGEAAGGRNVVGANAAGIEVDDGGQSNFVSANFVGVGANGVSQVGNKLQGIVIRSNDGAAPPLGPGQPNEPGTQNNQIGGTVPGDGNTVAFNGTGGVAVFGNPVATSGDQNAGNAVEGNSIFLNGRGFATAASAPTPLLGIDLSNAFTFPREDGLTPNDSKGHGAANDPNNFQNFPVLTSVTLPAGGGTTIAGTFTQSTQPNTMLRLELFANNPDPLNLPAEGQTFLGFVNVTTDGGGKASFSLTVATTLTSSQSVTATATSTSADPSSPAGQPNSGNTSEFSAAARVQGVITLTGASFNATVGAVFSGTVVTFTDTDLATTPNSYTATINWGDQTTTSGTITGANGSFSVQGSHTYGQAGTFTVTVQVTQNAPGTASGMATSTATVSGLPPTPTPSAKATTVGVFDPTTATWFLRGSNSAGAPDAGLFQYGPAGAVPVSGDWTGRGRDGIGVFDPQTFTWFLRNQPSAGLPDAGVFQYGGVGFFPVTGDWNDSGETGIGVFDPTTATWYLRNEPNDGAPDAGQFRYGVAGGIPVVGDWAGTGHLGIGVFDPQTFTWYLRSSVSAGPPDIGVFQYGGIGWRPVAGDWTGAGHAGIGAFDPSTATFYLRTEPTAGAPDAGQFAFGSQGFLPVAGHFPPLVQHLLAADGEGPGGAAPLGQDQLQAAVSAALARLAAAGVDPGLLQTLGSARFAVGRLPDGVLGQTDVAADQVLLSADAAGYGWFVDPTPGQDEEFAPGSPLVAPPGSPAAGKMDLLTAVLHEMGHLAGSPDEGAASRPGDLMADMLAPGARDLGALDQVFARGDRPADASLHRVSGLG
jgi:hypothetical protein